jgi:hypothetical protein
MIIILNKNRRFEDINRFEAINKKEKKEKINNH